MKDDKREPSGLTTYDFDPDSDSDTDTDTDTNSLTVLPSHQDELPSGLI